MGTIRNLLKRLSPNTVEFVGPQEPVSQVLKTMADYDLSAVLIMEKDQIVGIFSEKDYARKLLLKGKSSLTTPVKKVMKTKIIYVTPDYSLEEGLALMVKKRIRHLPIIDDGRLLAVASMEAVVEALLEDKVFHIAELTRYVTGSTLYETPLSPLPSQVKELVWEADRNPPRSALSA